MPAEQNTVNGSEVNGLFSSDSKLIVRALLDNRKVLQDMLNKLDDVVDKLNDIKEKL